MDVNADHNANSNTYNSPDPNPKADPTPSHTHNIADNLHNISPHFTHLTPASTHQHFLRRGELSKSFCPRVITPMPYTMHQSLKSSSVESGGALRPFQEQQLHSAVGKSSESVQCTMLKACDACADMGLLWRTVRFGRLSRKTFLHQCLKSSSVESGALRPFQEQQLHSAVGKSSESVQCAMLKACDACAATGQL